MDFLTLRNWCGEAPDYTNEVSKLEGICNTIVALNTEMEKAAFLIWCSAVQLQKVDAEINRVMNLEPNDLSFHLIQLEYPINPSMHGVTLAHLGMFEDLYYASVAKAKELLHVVELLLNNDFKKEEDVYFSYSSAPLNSLGPITYGGFKKFVTSNCSLLLDEELINILKCGVIERTKQDIESGISLEQDPYPGIRRIEDAQLLNNVQNMNSAMIFGHLTEKYRHFAMGQNGSSLPQAQGALTHGAFTPAETTPIQPYISPYNLNERGKIFDMEGGADLPCICDPDCICYPVCTSDRTQNCLCEENGLFTRVMEGADIDELDVPDMIKSPAASSHDADDELNSTGDTESEEESHISDTEELATDFENMTIVPTDGIEREMKTYNTFFEHAASPVDSNFGKDVKPNNVRRGEIRGNQFAFAQSDAYYPTDSDLACLRAIQEPSATPSGVLPKPLSNRHSIVRILFPGSRLARKLEAKYVASLNAEAKLGVSKVIKHGKNGGRGKFHSRRIQRLALGY